jgi:O-antigen ligase/cytochrome c-type biogenesis protein CcmH/NrfG
MNRVFASAMIGIMALVLCTAVLALGAVTPELALPAFALIGLLGVLWALRLIFNPDAHWKPSATHWPIGAFFVYALARYFFSPLEYDARFELFQIAACALIYFIAANQFYHRFDRTTLIWTLTGLAVFEASYGLWQFATASDAVFGWVRPEGYRGRASGTYICPNHLAGFLEIALAMILSRVVIVRRETSSLERSVLLKIILTYVSIMAILGIVFSFSRTGWITAILGLLLLTVSTTSERQPAWVRFAVLSIGIALIIGIAWSLDPVRNYVLRTMRISETRTATMLKDPSLGGRTWMWSGTLKMIRDHPVIGSGGGSWQWHYQKYRHVFVTTHPEYAHNDILNVASDYGLPAALLIAAVFVGFYRTARRLIRPDNPSEIRAFAVGAAIAATVLLVHSWFDFNMHVPANALLMATILGFTAAVPERNERFGRVLMSPLRRYALATLLLISIGFGGWLYGRTALASLYTDLGQTARSPGNYAPAIAYFERALALDSKAPRTWLRLADVYRTQARWRLGPDKREERVALSREAIAAYEQSIRLNPFDAQAFIGLGHAQEMAELPDQALISLKRATEIEPCSALAHFTLGRFYRNRGELKLAQDAFSRSQALTSDPAIDDNLIDLQEQLRQQEKSAAPK